MKHKVKAFGARASAHWYEKLCYVFVAVLLGQMIAIFDNFWWDETYKIAYWTLALTAASEVLLPYRMRLLKTIVQLCALFAVTIHWARMEWVVAQPERWQDWIWWLQAHFAQLSPYIWIGGALWLLVALFGRWTTTRSRLLAFTGAALLVLTIADSFSPIWLWDEVGVAVFVGLLWLFASHMARLQREHPSSWRELLGYPVQLLLPIAVVLTVLMSVGLSMPSISPILQDPYTLWKESKGESVPTFLGEKGLDASSPSSSGNASSGYSRDDQTLGGGFDFDYSPMMTVTTNQRSYWRGESKAFYNGTGWEDAGDAEDRGLIERVRKGQELASLDAPPAAGVIEVNQLVTMVRKDAYPVLFSASPASMVNWIGSENGPFTNGLNWLPASQELRFQGRVVQSQGYPEVYSVTSTVPVIDEDGLRSTEAGWSGAGSSARHAMYTQLPDSLPQRVKDLAAEVTAEGATDYDKARLLEAYLQTNFFYNNKPDLSKLSGQSGDFVDQFLFELKEGYCDYFSTAMIVMARSLDLPARWVKGFAPGVLPAGTFDPTGEMPGGVPNLDPSGAGTYTVRNSDAHSWVEIYFDGYGWISFEPTSGFSFPYTLAEAEVEPLPEVETESEETVTTPVEEQKPMSPVWGWAAAVLLLVSAGWYVYVRRQRLAAAWMKLRHGSYTDNDRIVLETQRLLRIAKRRGLVRQDHETMREAILRWSGDRKWLQGDFRTILDGFEQAKYGSTMATREEADRFVLKTRSVIDQLK